MAVREDLHWHPPVDCERRRHSAPTTLGAHPASPLLTWQDPRLTACRTSSGTGSSSSLSSPRLKERPLSGRSPSTSNRLSRHSLQVHTDWELRASSGNKHRCHAWGAALANNSHAADWLRGLGARLGQAALPVPLCIADGLVVAAPPAPASAIRGLLRAQSAAGRRDFRVGGQLVPLAMSIQCTERVGAVGKLAGPWWQNRQWGHAAQSHRCGAS